MEEDKKEDEIEKAVDKWLFDFQDDTRRLRKEVDKITAELV